MESVKSAVVPLDKEFMVRVLRFFWDIDAHEDLFWCVENNEPVFFVTCDDFFWWGTGDLEVLTPENVHVLEQALADIRAVPDVDTWVYQCWASKLFAARARGMRPQGAYYKYIPMELWSLFDACGPVRGPDFHNPDPRPMKEKTHEVEAPQAATGSRDGEAAAGEDAAAVPPSQGTVGTLIRAVGLSPRGQRIALTLFVLALFFSVGFAIWLLTP